ncbi:MAG TPA: GntR family transcriptional regulator [Opitutaceae bacterium]|nr:GntR family transcriptional regulator [Opitutaceae bacterium]
MTAPTRVLAVLAPVRPGGAEPLHRQVEARLRALAALPDFRDGALLPDELTMANRMGVSRGTARAALIRLVHEGVLERKAGIGTRVSRPRAESGIQAWRSFSREMAAKGIRVENYRTGFGRHPATPATAAALRVAAGTPLLRLDRVRGWDGRPVLLSQSWLHPRLRLTGREDTSAPLYEWLERETGAVAATAREDFAAITALPAIARRLSVRPGTPLLLRCHTVADASGRPIEYAEVRYVSSRFTLTLDLRRENR